MSRPDVENGFNEWIKNNPASSNAPDLVARIAEARLDRLKRTIPEWYAPAAGEEKEITEFWERANRYLWNGIFEFTFLAALIVLLAWPWLRNAGPLTWAVCWGLVPFLFFVPFWLGYARHGFTSAPHRGILYPELVIKCRGPDSRGDDRWTSFDATIVRSLPPVLEPLSQFPGPIHITGRPEVGPVAALEASLVVAVCVLGAGIGMRALKNRWQPPEKRLALQSWSDVWRWVR
jgi:hypothetical protein